MVGTKRLDQKKTTQRVTNMHVFFVLVRAMVVSQIFCRGPSIRRGAQLGDFTPCQLRCLDPDADAEALELFGFVSPLASSSQRHAQNWTQLPSDWWFGEGFGFPLTLYNSRASNPKPPVQTTTKGCVRTGCPPAISSQAMSKIQISPPKARDNLDLGQLLNFVGDSSLSCAVPGKIA